MADTAADDGAPDQEIDDIEPDQAPEDIAPDQAPATGRPRPMPDDAASPSERVGPSEPAAAERGAPAEPPRGDAPVGDGGAVLGGPRGRLLSGDGPNDGSDVVPMAVHAGLPAGQEASIDDDASGADEPDPAKNPSLTT